MRTKGKVRSETLDVLFNLEEAEIVENVEANQEGLLVEDSLFDANTLQVAIPADLAFSMVCMSLPRSCVDMILCAAD